MFLGIGQAAQHGVWSTRRRYVKGKDKLQREGPGKLLPHWSGCSVGWAEDWGQIPVLTCCAKDIICRAVYSEVEGSTSPHIYFAEIEHKLSGLCFILLQTHSFFQGHENVLQQHRKTISHPAPPMRWKQSLIGSCCLLTLALGETILIGQKWTCFSDCSFSSLLALWDFLFMDKETAASPVSAQRNCNCANWATLS